MNEYWKPWRRKFGAVILLVTFLVVAGWVRSGTKAELDSFSPKICHFIFFSANQGWRLKVYREQPPRISISCVSPDRVSHSSIFCGNQLFQHMELNERFDKAEKVSITEHREDGESEISLWPYWTIVAPLSTFLIWMFLANRRRKSKL